MKCKHCRIELQAMNPKEEFEFYIGNHCLNVVAYVPKQGCPKCDYVVEDVGGRRFRNTATRRAIDQFWRKTLGSIMSPEEVQKLKWRAKQGIEVCGETHKNLIAQSFGMWLADCLYVD